MQPQMEAMVHKIRRNAYTTVAAPVALRTTLRSGQLAWSKSILK